MAPMIMLYTDFGFTGPYLGQVKMVLSRAAPGATVIDLCADVPSFDPYAAAYLLAALAPEFPRDSICLGVVDPGVGTAREAVVINADNRWYVGPNNGLFEIVARRAHDVQCWEITWRPQRLSASFHGRDLFAPIAARLARGESIPGTPHPWVSAYSDWPDDRAAIIYQDHYGNCFTGLRMSVLSTHTVLSVAGHQLRWARTFGMVTAGSAFWYENANGLAEIAVNCGNAAVQLGLRIGDAVLVI